MARKHCGNQRTWSISLEKLHKKSGSKSSLKRFRQSFKGLVEANHLPDYQISYNRTRDTVLFLNRAKLKLTSYHEEDFPTLHSKTYEKAKKLVPSLDIYVLEEDWRTYWIESGKPELESPGGAFIGFCKRRQERSLRQ